MMKGGVPTLGCRGAVVAFVAVVAAGALGGCRQLLGIDDTEVARDAPPPGVDGPGVVVDAPPGRPDAIRADAAMCPSDYVLVGTKRYRVATVNRAWPEAVAGCANDSPAGLTHLAIPDDASENSGLAMVSTDLWIGISDLQTEGVWMTVLDAPPGYFNWEISEPTNTTQQNCVRLSPNGDWEDESCGNNRRFVCECVVVEP